MNTAELKVTGTIKEVLPEQSGTGKKGAWTKQDFVITTADQYPKTICFTAWNDLTDVVSNLLPDQKVTVSFNPESREYQGKYFTDLRAWKIAKGDKGSKPEPKPAQAVATEEDDLPF